MGNQEILLKRRAGEIDRAAMRRAIQESFDLQDFKVLVVILSLWGLNITLSSNQVLRNYPISFVQTVKKGYNNFFIPPDAPVILF